MEGYRPLPDSVTIKNSPIEGLGLFATKKIPEGTDLGITHFGLYNADLAEIAPGLTGRTPLGAFYNHSDNPNCFKNDLGYNDTFRLMTLRDIEEGEELTVKYTFYKVDRP